MPLDKRTAAKLAGLVLALTLVVFGAAKWSRPAPHASPPTPALAATDGTGVGPAQDATGQAINVKLGVSPTPCGGTGVGPLQDSTMQCVYTAISGGSAGTCATVTSGSTYTLLSTDTCVRFDTTGGTTATVDMIAPGFIGRRITFYWWAWAGDAGGPTPPTVVADSGHTMVPFAGQATSGAPGLASTTSITTPGASYTLLWDGSEWVNL